MSDYQNDIAKLTGYYHEFLDRSDKYQQWLKEYSEITSEFSNEEFILIPTNIYPNKKRKPIKPDELKKPDLFSFVSCNDICGDITEKFQCDSNRRIVEIDIEKPLEIIMEKLKEIIRTEQLKHWEEMKNENWYGEYRYLSDYKIDSKGRKITRRFKDWDIYLKVYDLKKQGKKHKEIGEIIFKNNKEAEGRSKKAYLKAKQLIKAAEENRFPP